MQLLIIQVVIFVVLVVVLRLLFNHNLNSALSDLRKLQKEASIKEAQIREELERAKQERFAEVEKGRREARELIEKAKKDSEGLRLKAEERAREESEKIVSYGKDDLEKLRNELLEDIDSRALSLAVEIIRHIFTDKGKEHLQQQLMDDVIFEIESIDKKSFSVKVEKAKIKSPSAMSKEEKEHLKNALSSKLGYSISLEEEIDAGLITGLIVQMGEFIIDGSLKNKLKKVIPYLKKH